MSKTTYDGAIGIDLGTTYSCVAVYRGTDVEIIANDQGSFTTPSFVSFSGDERLVGDAAKNQASMNPENTVFDVKRLIGRRFADETVKQDAKSWPFKIVEQGGNPTVEVQYRGEAKTFTPQEISAMILTKMKEIAEAKLDQTVTKAVITVPAYFNDNQRQATKDAGSIAGLEVLRIINEPTAAAIAYGFGKENATGRNVLIYDLGGGTFDVSLLTIEGQVFTVKATAGDTHLGGQDFDTNVLNFLKDVFQKQTGKDISTNARALRKLRSACERAKRTLSNAATTTVEVDSLFDGEDFEYNLSRARFEELNNTAFTSTLEPVEKVLKDAGIPKDKIDSIVLVGGSTRIPRIQSLLLEFFDNKKKLDKNINPDEAVAYGAAVQAGILTGKASSKVTDDFLLLDVVPLSLGVAMEGNIFAPVVQRGQTVPTIKKRTFTTVADNQTTVQFPVFQGERANCEDNVSLGEFTLAPIPPMRAGETVLQVIFEVNTDGILKVTATEASTGHTANITISNATGKLSQAEIQNMINNASSHEKDDLQFKARVEERHKLEELVNNISKANIPKARAKRVENALNDVQNVLDTQDADSAELHKAWLGLKRLVLSNKLSLPTA